MKGGSVKKDNPESPILYGLKLFANWITKHKKQVIIFAIILFAIIA
jgi:hypothetical protein